MCGYLGEHERIGVLTRVLERNVGPHGDVAVLSHLEADSNDVEAEIGGMSHGGAVVSRSYERLERVLEVASLVVEHRQITECHLDQMTHQRPVRCDVLQSLISL